MALCYYFVVTTEEVAMPNIQQEVDRTRKLLARLIRVAGFTRAEVDAELGEGRGYSTRVLNGLVSLKHEHTLTLLQAIGVDPGDFFRLLYPRTEDRTSGGSLGRLLEQMHRTDTETSSDDPEEALPPAAAAPSAPLDTDDLAQRIAALLRREDLLKKPRA
jgi:hypothetical protein